MRLDNKEKNRVSVFYFLIQISARTMRGKVSINYNGERSCILNRINFYLHRVRCFGKEGMGREGGMRVKLLWGIFSCYQARSLAGKKVEIKKCNWLMEMSACVPRRRPSIFPWFCSSSFPLVLSAPLRSWIVKENQKRLRTPEDGANQNADDAEIRFRQAGPCFLSFL